VTGQQVGVTPLELKVVKQQQQLTEGPEGMIRSIHSLISEAFFKVGSRFPFEKQKLSSSSKVFLELTRKYTRVVGE
jgi:hypothetical protein